MSKSQCASSTSRPLFIRVAESMVIFGPIRQVGWAKACSTVTERTSSSEERRNGPPDAVRMRRRISRVSSPRRHCQMALCSLSTGKIETLCSRATCITRCPAMTSVSLFDRAMVFPARMRPGLAVSPSGPMWRRRRYRHRDGLPRRAGHPLRAIRRAMRRARLLLRAACRRSRRRTLGEIPGLAAQAVRRCCARLMPLFENVLGSSAPRPVFVVLLIRCCLAGRCAWENWSLKPIHYGCYHNYGRTTREFALVFVLPLILVQGEFLPLCTAVNCSVLRYLLSVVFYHVGGLKRNTWGRSVGVAGAVLGDIRLPGSPLTEKGKLVTLFI